MSDAQNLCSFSVIHPQHEQVISLFLLSLLPPFCGMMVVAEPVPQCLGRCQGFLTVSPDGGSGTTYSGFTATVGGTATEWQN